MRILLTLGIFLSTLLATPAVAANSRSAGGFFATDELRISKAGHGGGGSRVTAGEGAYHNWLFSPGFGFTMDPGGFLITSQLEYVANSRFFYGPFVDVVFINSSLLFVAGGSMRLVFGSRQWRPTVEAGAGIAIASGGGDTLGFHFHFGMGIDYTLTPGITVGTMLKPSFNPPIDSFMLNWPVIIGRFAF